MAELKKCPFCGGEAVLDREDIFCDNCHLSMRIDDRKYNGEAETYAEAREQTIEAWNNRVTESEIRAKAIEDIFEIMDNAVAHSSDHDERSMVYWVGFLKSEIEWAMEQLKERE